ncbi:hypothetical protein ACOSQ3_001704 [Xanthoceras sorbifolium]
MVILPILLIVSIDALQMPLLMSYGKNNYEVGKLIVPHTSHYLPSILGKSVFLGFNGRYYVQFILFSGYDWVMAWNRKIMKLVLENRAFFIRLSWKVNLEAGLWTGGNLRISLLCWYHEVAYQKSAILLAYLIVFWIFNFP